MRIGYIYDTETLKNCFVYVAEHYKEDELKVYVIHDLKNDFKELIKHLKESQRNKNYHIGFNNIAFDAQLETFIIKNENRLLKLTGCETSSLIYSFVQDKLITEEHNSFLPFKEKDFVCNQIDLYKMNHWDNDAKRSSLKWIQFSIDWNNVQEMPIHHSTKINTIEQINEIVSYCINDVKSTKKIYNLCKNQLNLRFTISNKYDLNCLSYSNTKIGSELLLKLYCKRTNKEFYEVRKSKTIREQMNFSDIIFSYIEFKTPQLQKFLDSLKPISITGTKKAFDYKLNFKGFELIYGTGGLHQCHTSNIYYSDDEYIIIDLDVASLYPSIAIVNKMYPAHLGEEFYYVYKEDIVDVRLSEKAKKDKGDKAIVEGFKEAANASYGNSNQQHSWLFDSFYTMQTTINGQLMLTMLIEELLITLSNAILIQTNTDGATIRLKRSEVDIYYNICNNWCKKTQLILEYAEYNKMFVWDVNSYIGLYSNGKTKCKGRFEWEDLQNHKPSHLHKNKSFLIIPKAIYNYFINGIKPEDYLASSTNIFDYCGGVKAKGNWYIEEHSINNGKYKINKLQKIVRYYISKEGVKLVKKNPDGRQIQVEAGKWLQTTFNVYEEKPFEEYNINLEYYLQDIYKEINAIDTNINRKYTQLLMNF